MALGVTTPGPLVPCMSGLRFVSAPTFRWSASSYATPSASRRGLGRQMSTRESDMWSGLKAGTGPGGKPVIDSGTRKWGCSMEHISSARQQKIAFNNEETAVATNGCYSADYRQGRPIRGPYRGQNAVEREALALGRVRISEPDRVLDDRALASRRSQNGMINSPVTGHSLLDERVGPSTFWLEGSDKPASMHSVCPEQESYSKHWSASAADIDRVAPSQRSQRPRQTSFTALQREGSYPPQASYDGNFSIHGERNAMNRISASADLCTEDLVQSDVSNRSRQISRGFEHTSNGFCRTSSQNTYVYEESDEPSLAYSDKALESGESVPLRDGAYSYQCHGNPRNYTGKNIAGKATNNKYGSPQKSIVQPSQKISCGGMGEINSDSVMSDGYSSYGRQKYYAIGKQSTHQTDVTFNRKSDCYNVLAQKSKFEHRLNEEESFLSSFSEYYPNEALNRGQSVSKQLVDLQLLETQTRQRQNARLDSFISSHNHHGPGMFAKETSIAEKSNSESGSSWREEGKKITARIMQAADSIGIAKADSKHRMSYTCSASGHEELSTISKQGRGNMVGVSASKIVVSHSVPQTHKLEPAGVEKDVFSASSITSQVGSNRGELAKSSVARLNGKPQEQKLERRSDAEICLGNNSIGMCVESSETVEHCLDNTTSTGDSINETAISAVCFSNNNLNKSVQLQSEKPEKGDHDLDNTIRVNYGHNGTITFAACYGNNSSNKSIQLQYGKQFSNLADREGKILSAGKGEFRLLRENGHLQDCSVGGDKKETLVINGKHARTNENEISTSTDAATGLIETKGGGIKERLNCLYKNIFIVDKVETAKMVVAKLMGEYKHLVHACDTEVANIDVKKESPVGHGNIICFSIYCGPQADFGKGKSCVWVDVLDGGEDVLGVFAPYFEDSSIRKVWHNYSFDCHIMANHGINVCGFHADTMHLARLWNSARRGEGGYSLEALTKDPKVMNGAGMVGEDELIAGKVSMKTIFGKKKTKKDGSEGKIVTVASVEELQRTERIPWICYSALDSMSTLRLWKSLQGKLMCMDWVFQGVSKGNMYDFYEEYWRPFGELLVQMESTGMLVDRKHLSEMEKVAIREQEISASRFRKWASKYCSDASYMNVSSDTQVRQLLFGGMPNKKDPKEFLPLERTLKVPNVDNFIEEGKKAPTKFRNIVLRGLGVKMQVETYTASGWPAVTGEALRMLAGKVSIDYDSLEKDMEDGLPADTDEGSPVLTSGGVKIGETTVGTDVEVDSSVYGTAYHAFGGGQNGREACHAIAALCEVSSINTLISNFLQPLQESQILGRKGRVHCSLNINTETGRLSARRPNLQNQPALEKDRYKIRQAFIADPGMTLIVADYGQLELRILAHLSNCKSMLDAFRAGGDFHSRTAMNMYEHVRKAVENKEVLLEWDPQPGEEKPPVPLLKDVFATERRRAKMLNFSIAYGKTAVGLSKDWKVSLKDAKETLKLWYNERPEVLKWQEERKHEACSKQCVHTLLGRSRHFPNLTSASPALRGHIERAAINAPVQGSAADVAMCAMLQIARNERLEKLGWKLLLQVHDEVILEGPIETAEEAKSLVVNCMSYPFNGKNILQVDLAVAATYGLSWYAAK